MLDPRLDLGLGTVLDPQLDLDLGTMLDPWLDLGLGTVLLLSTDEASLRNFQQHMGTHGATAVLAAATGDLPPEGAPPQPGVHNPPVPTLFGYRETGVEDGLRKPVRRQQPGPLGNAVLRRSRVLPAPHPSQGNIQGQQTELET
ncbi:hypothetical protein CB1_001541018 [Camelus ferus]|nr:hypothetical protein CB1_001541018 [Camelus ferus]